MSEAVARYLAICEKLEAATEDDPLYDEADAAWYALSEEEMREVERRLVERWLDSLDSPAPK